MEAERHSHTELFRRKVEIKAAERVDGDVESVWRDLKDCLLIAADEVCGRTKVPVRYKETWWWNEKVAEAIRETGRLHKV